MVVLYTVILLNKFSFFIIVVVVYFALSMDLNYPLPIARQETRRGSLMVQTILYLVLLRQEVSIKPHFTNYVPTQGF